MTTLAAMKTRIASELRRGNLTTQIAAAIATAIDAYQPVIKPEAESRSITFTTVQGQEFYTTGLSNILRFNYVKLYIGDQPFSLRASDPEQMESWSTNATATGQPSDWCWCAGQFRLYPVPAESGWTIRIGAMVNVAAPASDAETGNPWMTTYERLIRSRSKLELAIHVLRDPQLTSDMAKATQDAEAEVTIRSNMKRRGSGRVVPMAF